MAYFKFHEKNYWESSKLTNSKINSSSRENYAHFISCKPPHKNHPWEYFGNTLWFIQIATSVVEKSQILSVTFHLSTTVLNTLVDYILGEIYVPSKYSSAQYLGMFMVVVIIPPPGIGVIGSCTDNIGGRFCPMSAERKGAPLLGDLGFWEPSGVTVGSFLISAAFEVWL